jgi:hypothetical protein
MTIEWLAGNRIRGTSAERTTTAGIGKEVGGWVELGRHKLGSPANDWGVSGLADKRYLMLLYNETGHNGANGNGNIKYNADGGTSYASRLSNNGGTDWYPVNGTFARFMNDTATGEPQFAVGYVGNLSTKEKLGMIQSVQQNATGVTTSSVPEREESVHKWTDVSEPINQVNIYDNGGNNSDTGSELVVLGWDPTDTHTTNFWEELASVDLTGGAAATLSSGTFTAKKYLWVQYYTNSIASSTRPDLIFNSDTTSSYANRYNYNGTESVAPSENSHFAGVSANTNPFFANFFIINNAVNEKLSIGRGISTGGSGADVAPVQRFELAQKWARTSGSGTGDASAQITKITLTNDASANFGTSTYLKVWGSD